MHRALAALAALALSGCGYDLIGRWEIVELTAGEATTEDAGFLDLAEGDYRSGATNLFLVRYRYDLAADQFVPDPSPDVRPASLDVAALRDDDFEPPEMRLEFPGELQDISASLSLIEHTPGRLVMEDPDFADGAGMVWQMER